MDTLTRAEMALLSAYEASQVELRQRLAANVYNPVLRTLFEWDAFKQQFQPGGRFELLSEQYAADTALAAEAIAALEGAMQTIVGVMRAMEAADPGMFGIVVPEPPVEPEPEPES